MKSLKILLIASFLLIEGLGQHATLNFALLFLFLYQFINDMIAFAFPNIFWEGFIVIPIICTIFIFIRYDKYKNRYIQLLCIIALFITLIALTGIMNPENYNRISYGFIIPFVCFVISSIVIIFKNFKTPKV